MKKKNQMRAGAENPTVPYQAPSSQEGHGRPTITAVAFHRVPGQGWVSLTYKIQGDKVIQVQASEPDLKLIACEKFKINVGRIIMSDDGGLP